MEYLAYKDKIILDLIKKYRQKKDGKIIDVGAGNKPFLKVLPKDMEYLSIDIDPKRKPTILCDIEKKLPLKDKEYDFVICSEVLEHTLYPKEVVKELKRIVKDNGFIIISMPNEYNFYLRLKFLLGVQNNTEIPFREKLWKNHIHKARVKDLIYFYKENLDIQEIAYIQGI